MISTSRPLVRTCKRYDNHRILGRKHTWSSSWCASKISWRGRSSTWLQSRSTRCLSCSRTWARQEGISSTMPRKRREWKRLLLERTPNCSRSLRSHHSSQWGSLECNDQWIMQEADQIQELVQKDHRVKVKRLARECTEQPWPRGKENKNFRINIANQIQTWLSNQTLSPNTGLKMKGSHYHHPSETKPNLNQRDLSQFNKRPSQNLFQIGKDRMAQKALMKPNKMNTMSLTTEPHRSHQLLGHQRCTNHQDQLLEAPQLSQWKDSSLVASLAKRKNQTMMKKQNTSQQWTSTKCIHNKPIWKHS